MARLLSVNVVLPRDVTWNGKTVRTSVWKSPLNGRRMVRKLNIDGDAQADLEGHGGEHRAVFVTPDRFTITGSVFWAATISLSASSAKTHGGGLADDEVCIGDRYRIGDAIFEVTQPRVTCYRVGIRMNEPRMASLLVAHRRPGFYFRVLQEGEVGAGDDIAKIANGVERITVAEIDALLYLPGHSREQLNARFGSPLSVKAGKVLFRQCSNQMRVPKPCREIRGSQMRSKLQPGPDSDQCEIAHIRKESDSVTSFVLAPNDGQPLPCFQSGQFVVLRLLVDSNKPAVLRSYSLSDQPQPDHLRISGIASEVRF